LNETTPSQVEKLGQNKIDGGSLFLGMGTCLSVNFLPIFWQWFFCGVTVIKEQGIGTVFHESQVAGIIRIVAGESAVIEQWNASWLKRGE